MYKTVIIFILGSIFMNFWIIGCIEDQQTTIASDVETMISHKKYGKVKSYQRMLDRYEIKDSIVFLNYQIITPKDTVYNYYFELPINGKMKHQYNKEKSYSDFSIKLIDSVSVRLNKEKYEIYKYEFDELYSYDEEMLLYYVKDIGIIRQESYIWMNHSVLVEHHNVDKALLYGLHEKIRYQLKPFRSSKVPVPKLR